MSATASTAFTRQGWIVLVCAVLTAVTGRVFGVLELYFLSAAMLVAAVIALVSVLLRRPRVVVRRWVRPEVLTAGDVGRVDIVLRANGIGIQPAFELVEAVGDDRTARMAVAPMRGGTERSAGYRVPTERRGVLTIGPLVATRHDLLGLACSTRTIAGVDEILVAPRAFELAMPELGDGILGRHLLAQSVRLGPGEFHSLREYVPGDEPRTIHWRASARSDDLKVRQHTAEGLRRCTIVLDQQVDDPREPFHADGFERGVVASASLVHSADRAGLQTRFTTTGGADLRGPTVSTHTLHHLARVMPDERPPRPIERDPGEGLGLVFVVTTSSDSLAWRTLGEMRDPSLTLLGVFTEQPGHAAPKMFVDARSEAVLLKSWTALVGTRRSGVPRLVDPLADHRAPGGRSMSIVAERDRRAPDRIDDAAAADAPPLPIGVDLVATLGLAAYSIAVSVGFSRVFTGWDFLRDLVIICLVGHGSSYLLRRLRAPAIVAIPVVLVVLTWLVAWLYSPGTFSAVFPLADTWEAVRADFRVAADQFQTSTAPVPYEAGWAFMAGATTAAAVWLSDTFAFRAQARGEALVPGAVLFVFIAALGVDEHRVACSLAVIGAGFCALALLRQRAERRPRTALGRAPHPLLVTIPAALVAAVVVMAGAWAIAPHLPGADDEPLFDTRGDSGSAEVISPLVDIRSRIVNQAEDELFTVVASANSYWRLAALPEFGDDQWDLPDGLLEGAEDQLNAALPGSVANVQEITITGLGGSFVPVAPEPVRARGPGATYESLSSSLFKAGSRLDEGDVYDVTSAMPRFTADQLRAASSDDPPDSIFTELPDDLPAEIAATAAEVTASSSNGFEQMVLLQDWFRSEFTYSTDVPDGNGTSAIISFLENRVGYCEQFAGTFAVMARTLDLPTRVAVGFTQGEPTDGGYVVRGRNSHAWPEVWFDGLGWVPFEPTPGRGMPGAEAYTGIAPVPDQADPSTATTTTTIAPTTTVAGAQPAPTTTVAGAAAPTTTNPAAIAPVDPAASDDGSPWPWLAILAAVAVVGLVLAAPALVRRWRRSRRKPTSDPAHMLLELWDRALAALGAMGFRASPAMTPLEVSNRAAAAFPAVAEPLQRLAAVATTASYAPRETVAAVADADRHHRSVPPFDDVAGRVSGSTPTDDSPSHDTPHDWCAAVETAVEDSLTLRARVRRYFTVWR